MQVDDVFTTEVQGIVTFLHIKQLRFREVKLLVQDHTGTK